jgi:hypothetical protein
MARQTIQRPLGETVFEFLVSSIKSCVEGSTQYNTDLGCIRFGCSFGELMPCVGNGLLLAITSLIMMVSLVTYRKIEIPWRDYGRLGKTGMFHKGVNSLKHTEMMT